MKVIQKTLGCVVALSLVVMARSQEAVDPVLAQVTGEYRALLDRLVARHVAGGARAEHPTRELTDRCLATAAERAGTAAAVPLLVWVVQHAIDDAAPVRRALDILARDHIENPAWADVFDVILSTAAMLDGARIDALLVDVPDANPHAEVGARARFARAVRAIDAVMDGAMPSTARADLEAVLSLTKDVGLQAEARALLAAKVEAKSVLFVDAHEDAVRSALRRGRQLLVEFAGFNCSSCRLMESGVLRQPEVEALLAAGFVESRLHVDTANTLTKERFEANVALQRRFTDTLALPLYVLVDPRTGCPIRTHQPGGAPQAWQAGFVAFLRRP